MAENVTRIDPSHQSENVPVKHAFALDDNQAFAAHRDQNAAPDVLDEVEERLRSNNVEFIYYQIPTLNGRLVAKVVPVGHFRKTFLKGILQHRTSMADLQTDQNGNLLGGGIEAQEFCALPDPETLVIQPWDTTVARVFCSAYEPAYLPDVGGRPLVNDSRAAMRRIHAAFADEFGATVKSGCEPEMTWAGPGMDVIKRDGVSPAYQVKNLEIMRPTFQRIIRYGQKLGLDMIQGDYEDDGQLELNWMYDDIDLTADRLVMYRQICTQVAGELGITASFMPKPRVGIMGNGCHHNVSVWKGDTNLLVDPDNPHLHVSRIGSHMVGGLMQHTPDAMLAMASTVNSYKRFWDAGQFAPNVVNWGLDDRAALIRISSIGRMEYRVADSAVNPYLSHALVVAALADGWRNKTDPGAPGSQNSGMDTQPIRVPTTLGDAVEQFSNSSFVRNTLPEELVDTYVAMKRDEWARFCGTVTDWEFANYWETLS